MTTTPADPAAIDLDAVRARYDALGNHFLSADVHDLIAAVEALRKRVVELEGERDLAVAHDRQPYPTAAEYEVVCKARMVWQRRANTAEARVVELMEGA